MLFNSFGFIFVFLPIVVAGFVFLNRLSRYRLASIWLLGASLLFYGVWNPRYLVLILGSIGINYAIGRWLAANASAPHRTRKLLLWLGLAFNLGLLGYFKYVDFFISNVNGLTGLSLPLQRIALPLAISFFSLQQITFIVDAYEGLVKETDLVHYALFVTVFPHLIAGPITHHRTMVGQFADVERRQFKLENLTTGIFVFSIGLAKKVLLADNLARAASEGFKNATRLSLPESWLASLSYTFQLYFDFSGYADMAIGAALMLGLNIPVNFSSPFRARGMVEFWQRWHMTLSNFITTYLYTPMLRAAKRATLGKAMLVTLTAMLIAGLWHGAAWTFVIFGALHGVGIVVNQVWKRKVKKKLPGFLAWLITFSFVNMTFVFFRANSLSDALHILKAMVGINGITVPISMEGRFGALKRFGVQFGTIPMATDTLFRGFLLLALGFLIVFAFKNTEELTKEFKPGWRSSVGVAAALVGSIFCLTEITEFLYFNF
jgi:D-alanyl-lipoteichoic acid acyltransferase DltB (MBOAT superfamily)